MLVWAIADCESYKFQQVVYRFPSVISENWEVAHVILPPPPPTGLYLGVVGRLTGPKTQLTQAKIIILF